MDRDVNQLQSKEKYLSAFLTSMKQGDQESIEQARKALRQMKSYSTSWQNGRGFRIRIKGGKEERVLHYAFPRVYGDYMKKVTETVNLTTGTTGFIENTGGFLLHYLAQRGIDAQGFSMHEKAWEKSLLANFPVYRREYLRKPLPPLNMPETETPAFDRLIWIVRKSPGEAAFVADLYRRKSPDLLVFLPPGESFRREDFPGHVLEEEELPSVMGDTRFLLISPREVLEREKTPFPEGLEVLKTPSAIFMMDMEKCRDNNGFQYTEPGHYFVETLRQYEANEYLDYEGSCLMEYYHRFQPRNRRDNYLLEEEGDIFPLDHGWLYDPWRKPANPPLRKERFETRKGGNHNLGPNTEEFGQAEFKRLVNAYNNLKEQGYHPDFFVDGYITGYLLIRKNDYRFVTSEGQHRIAALAALGYKKLICRFDLKPWTSEIVFYNQAHKWPQVKAGIFNPRVAKLCFEHFFRQDNNQRLMEKTDKK